MEFTAAHRDSVSSGNDKNAEARMSKDRATVGTDGQPLPYLTP